MSEANKVESRKSQVNNISPLSFLNSPLTTASPNHRITASPIYLSLSAARTMASSLAMPRTAK